MSGILICEDCDEGNLPVLPEEDKTEEQQCVYCNYEIEAECLLDGRPACAECKLNRKSQQKSPAGSSKSDLSSGRAPIRKKSPNTSFETDQRPALTLPSSSDYALRIHGAIGGFVTPRKSEATVPAESLKANKFLLKYTSNKYNELVCLYNTRNDGYSSSAFHSRVDNKGGIIIIVCLSIGYEIAAYSWKGIRKGVSDAIDVQSGGAIIKNNTFEFVTFPDQAVINQPEGIRFSRQSALFINFDRLEESECNFDRQLRTNPNWTSLIEEISVYKLQVN